MPTSSDEARKIVEIINEYLDAETGKAVTSRLYEEVGKHTNNASLKVSLQMLKSLYSEPSSD